MKKINYFLLAFVTFIELKAQTVSTNRVPLITKITATWCNSCGTWGWSLNEEIMNQNPEALTICLHASSSSQLYDVEAADMYAEFSPQSSGIPSWYVDGRRQTQYSGSGGIYTSLTRDAVKNASDSTLLYDALAGSGFLWTLNGNNIEITSKTEFFSNVSGEYRLGVYFIEDDIVKYQNGIGNSAIHHPTLRAAVTTDLDLLHNGTISQGTQFTKNYTFTIPSDWNKSKVRIVGVVWKTDGTIKEIVNTSVSGYLEALTSKETAINSKPRLFPNPASQGTFAIQNVAPNTNVKIFDMLGKQVECKKQIINGGILISVSENTPKGIYFVQIQDNRNNSSQKLILE